MSSTTPQDRFKEFQEKWAHPIVDDHNFCRGALGFSDCSAPHARWAARGQKHGGVYSTGARLQCRSFASSDAPLVRPECTLDPTASQAVQSLYIQNYNILMRICEDQLKADKTAADNIGALKYVIMSVATWGKGLAKRARGTGTESVTDHTATMWTRLSSKLDILDDAAVVILS
jgi:hypothetical protein